MKRYIKATTNGRKVRYVKASDNKDVRFDYIPRVKVINMVNEWCMRVAELASAYHDIDITLRPDWSTLTNWYSGYDLDAKIILDGKETDLVSDISIEDADTIRPEPEYEADDIYSALIDYGWVELPDDEK